MIQVYKEENKNFDFNGDFVLDPIYCTIKGTIGTCTLELEHCFDDDGKWELLTEGNVITSPTPFGSNIRFRIYDKVKNIDSITVYARQEFYDYALYTMCKDLTNKNPLIVRPTSANGQQALNMILKNTPYKGVSNITKTFTSHYERKTIGEALLSDNDNSFINRWGGEIFVTNDTVYFNEEIGSDNGVTIEYGKNLESIEEEVSRDEVATRIIPIGYNGIMLDGVTPWIDSPIINKYNKIYEREIKFEDIKVKEKEDDEEGFNTLAEAQTEMINRCNKLFEKGIDRPNVNIKIEMYNLANTVEYKSLGLDELESINLGDTVYAKHYKIGINTKTRCISYEWDALTSKYNVIELGDVMTTYFDKTNDVTNRVDNILNNDNSVNGAAIKGFLDGSKAKLIAQRTIAENQHVRAMLFEDLVPDSPTFGALCIGSAGFEIACKRLPDNSGWEWSTFGTGQGFKADFIVAGILSALNGNTILNLNTGEFKSKISDGSEIIISPQDGFYRKIGSNKNEYYSLTYYGEAQMPPYTGEGIGMSYITIQLPDEFKGKRFNVILTPKRVTATGYTEDNKWATIKGYGVEIYYGDIDYTNARFKVGGFVNQLGGTAADKNKNDITFTYTAIC